MSILDLIYGFIELLWQGLVLAGIPIVFLSVTRSISSRYAPEEFSAMPVFPRLCALASILLAITMLQLFTPEKSLHPEIIFAVNGPWDLTTKQFIFERINPLAFNFDYFSAQQESETAAQNLFVLWLISGILFGIVSSLAFLDRPFEQSVKLVAVCGVSIALIAYLFFYLASFLLWFLNTFNFWIFGLLLLLLRWPFRHPKARHH